MLLYDSRNFENLQTERWWLKMLMKSGYQEGIRKVCLCIPVSPPYFVEVRVSLGVRLLKGEWGCSPHPRGVAYVSVPMNLFRIDHFIFWRNCHFICLINSSSPHLMTCHYPFPSLNPADMPRTLRYLGTCLVPARLASRPPPCFTTGPSWTEKAWGQTLMISRLWWVGVKAIEKWWWSNGRYLLLIQP